MPAPHCLIGFGMSLYKEMVVHPDKPFSPESRRLLALSRDLFQATDEDSVLWLFKPVIFEFLRPRIALFRLNRKNRVFERLIDFGGEGEAAQWCELMRQHLYESVSARRDEGFLSLDLNHLSADLGAADADGSLLSFAFPPGNPVGTLSAVWPAKMTASKRGTMKAILQSFAELAGAALGNVADKHSMRYEATTLSHKADELSREFSASNKLHDEAMEEQERLATTDVLTGLLNRRGFFERAEHAMKVARRNKMKSAVVFADLDGLKAVNDTLGHDTGDRLLRAAGDVFAASFRESDVVARLGGDEFSAFALDASNESALLERVEDSVSHFHRTATTPYRISFSIGVVECNLDSPQSLADYLTAADNRMYHQKRERQRQK